MPLKTAYPIRTKTVKFLWDMVTAEMAATRSYDSDWQADAMYQEIVTALKIPDDFKSYVDSFATAVAYTQKLSFAWHPDTPPELRGFEAVWHEIVGGTPIAECFTQFRMVDITVLNGAGGSDPKSPAFVKGWRYAVSEGHAVWSPPLTRPMDNLTPEQKNDPDFLGRDSSSKNSS